MAINWQAGKPETGGNRLLAVADRSLRRRHPTNKLFPRPTFVDNCAGICVAIPSPQDGQHLLPITSQRCFGQPLLVSRALDRRNAGIKTNDRAKHAVIEE